MNSFEPNIIHDRRIQGGEAVIAGTRIPVRTIVEYYFRIYPNDLSAIEDAFPLLTERQICAALDYYTAHQTEIDAEIKSQEEEQQWPSPRRRRSR